MRLIGWSAIDAFQRKRKMVKVFIDIAQIKNEICGSSRKKSLT